MPLPSGNKKYTFADVLAWGEDERIEIIEIYAQKDLAKDHVLDGCFIEPSKVFRE